MIIIVQRYRTKPNTRNLATDLLYDNREQLEYKAEDEDSNSGSVIDRQRTFVVRIRITD